MARKGKPPAELASDICARAADLHAHGDDAADEALLFLWSVNPDVCHWLSERLNIIEIRHGLSIRRKARG